MTYLINGLKNFDCQGYKTCEIGVREGLGSKIIMDNVVNNYFHVGVDPYGNLKYQHYDDTGKYQCDYTDDMRDQMLKDFESYIKTGKFSPCIMTDTRFYEQYLNMQLVNLHLCIWMDLT
jgi:hypothetical protein